MANEDGDTKTARERSPSFPIIPLERALMRAQEFYDQEKRGSAPFSVAAQHWRYSPSSSGALQTVAAMRQYGLMADDGGSGMDRKVRLTELALRIILDTRSDSLDRAQFKIQAAQTPPIVQEIYSRWPDGLPSEQNLNHFLVLERQFNQQTAAKAVKIIKENELFTGKSANDMLSEFSQMETDTMSAAGVPARVDRGQDSIADAQIISTRPAGGVSVERFGGIEIRFDRPPGKGEFEALKKFAEFRISLIPDDE